MEKNIILRVRMKESDYAEIKRKAGFEPVSAWVRRMLLGEQTGGIEKDMVPVLKKEQKSRFASLPVLGERT